MKGSALTELRRSHAAGVHDSAPVRSAVKKKAIFQDMEDSGMSFMDEDYDTDLYDDFREPSLEEIEPSDEELAEIENEDYVPVDLDDEDYPHESDRELDPDALYA